VHLVIYLPLAVSLPLAVPLVAAACARPIASRLPPQAATWLLTGAAVALAGLSAAVLGVLALTAVIRIPLVADIGDMSLQVIHRNDPASLSAAVTAGTLLAAATAAACRAAWRRARALLAAARHARCLPGSSQVVVVPDGTADAYAVPGWPGRIVVTAGMLDALNPAERQVLLEHERAHATGHHYLFTALTYFAAAGNPLLRPVAAAVTYTIERWADERAARACGDRRLAARAIGKAALASAEGMTLGTPRRPAAAAAVGIAGIAGPAALRGAGRLRGAGPVPRRVAALLAPPPRIRPLLVVAVAGLVLISGVSALDAVRDLHTVVELAQAPRMS
jgi:Zn-dependent protease with chaperone function